MFLAVHYEFGEGGALAFAHRGIQQVIGLGTACPSPKHVGTHEIYRVDLRVVSLYDLHSAMSEGVKVQRRLPGEGRVIVQEAKSSKIRLAPSPGVQQSSNGILGRAPRRTPRMYKDGGEHRGRDSRLRSSKGPYMLVAGIDIGAGVPSRRAGG